MIAALGLFLVLPIEAQTQVDLGEFEIGAPARSIRWYGVLGAPLSAAKALRIQSHLAAAAAALGQRFALENPLQPAGDDGLEQQQTLELELALGLYEEAEARVIALLNNLSNMPAILHDHERYCRLRFAAAQVFEERARKSEARDQRSLLSACSADRLAQLSWAAPKAIQALRNGPKGSATLTLRGGWPGTRATIDGVALGALPLQLTDLPAGHHHLAFVTGAHRVDYGWEIAIGARVTHEVALQPKALAALADLRLSAAVMQALATALKSAGASHGLVAWKRNRGGFTGLCFDRQGKMAVLEVADPNQVAAALIDGLSRLQPLPPGGLRLPHLYLASGLPQRRFAEPAAVPSRLDRVPEALRQAMVDYAARRLGKNPATLRARLTAQNSSSSWRGEHGRWWSGAELGVSTAPQPAPAITLSSLRMQPLSSAGIWGLFGAQLSLGGAGAQPAGEGWNPMTYPLHPISAAEAELGERIVLQGDGIGGAAALAGLAYDRGGIWSLLALGHIGWRRLSAELVHQQFVLGVPDSGVELRRTKAFTWDGLTFGGRVLLLRRFGPWQTGVVSGFEASQFRAAQLDLVIPAQTLTPHFALVLGRAF
jgi:hypothetical protein